MRKILTAALAALSLGGALAATASPAAAQPYRWGGHGYYGGYYGHHHDDVAGPAIAAGVLGLAVGATLANSGNHYYAPSYGYGYGYAPAYSYGYAPGYYGYSYGPAYCEGGRWVWDPYIGRRVLVTSRYVC